MTAVVPFAQVIDNFNRTNENPLSFSGRWVGGEVSTFLQVTSNKATGTSTSQLSSRDWDETKFAADQECYITVTTLPSTGANYIRLYVRKSVHGSTYNGYMVQWSNDANGCRIFRSDAGTLTQIAQDTSATYAANDVILLRAEGTTITVYKNGVSVLSVVDSNYNASGYVALGCRDTTTRLEDYGAGELQDVATATVTMTPDRKSVV